MGLKIYNWMFLVDASQPGIHTYGLETPNKSISVTHCEESIAGIFINSSGEPERYIIQNLTTNEFTYKSGGGSKKIRNWRPVIERSTGLPEKTKKDLCALLAKIK